MKSLSFLLLLFSASTMAQDLDEEFLGSSLRVECQNNKNYFSRAYAINCGKHYHQYKAKSLRGSVRSKPKTIKIGEFNALHPGMNKTRFKDYYRMALIIDQYDIIGVTELIPLMSQDLKNNQNVIQFIESAPEMIEDTKTEIKWLEDATSLSSKEKIELQLYKEKLRVLKIDLKQARDLYRKPGYLKILEALHSLKDGKHWSLILSPQGEGSESTSTPELVGYFYRSDLITPQGNPYCRRVSKNDSESAACIVNMDEIDLGEDKSGAFSRKPFMGQFKAGNFEFIMLATHILFDSPTDEILQEHILQAAFQTSDYTTLGTGLTKSNYARFAETKITLEFISKYLKKHSKVKDVILVGDFNIRSTNPFWSEILPTWPGAELYIDQATSIKSGYFNSDDGPSHGLSSNYDHILFNPKETSECLNSQGEFNGGVINFMTGKVGRSIDRAYKVRYKYKGDGNIVRNDNRYDAITARFVDPYLNGVESIVTIARKYVTVGRYRKVTQGIVIDEKETENFAVYFKERVIDSQLEIDDFYYFYEQLISDHLPIYVDCKI